MIFSASVSEFRCKLTVSSKQSVKFYYLNFPSSSEPGWLIRIGEIGDVGEFSDRIGIRPAEQGKSCRGIRVNRGGRAFRGVGDRQIRGIGGRGNRGNYLDSVEKAALFVALCQVNPISKTFC